MDGCVCLVWVYVYVGYESLKLVSDGPDTAMLDIDDVLTSDL